MEKPTPHYSLNEIQSHVVRLGIRAFTRTAQIGLIQMNLTEAEAISVVLKLTRSNLYKSMTTHADNRVWQDVYHSSCPNGKTAYIKFTLREGAVVIQFKEK